MEVKYALFRIASDFQVTTGLAVFFLIISSIPTWFRVLLLASGRVETQGQAVWLQSLLIAR